jgi:hypothetical protein
MTVPTSGIVIAGGVVTATKTPVWTSPMNASLFDSSSGLYLGTGRTTCNPTFSNSDSFFNMSAGTWG